MFLKQESPEMDGFERKKKNARNLSNRNELLNLQKKLYYLNFKLKLLVIMEQAVTRGQALNGIQEHYADR